MVEKQKRGEEHQVRERAGDKGSYDDEWLDAELEEWQEEIQERRPLLQKKGVRRAIASLLVLMLLANILAFWPQFYSLTAIQFLLTSRELSKNEQVQTYRQAVVVVQTKNSKGSGVNIAEDGLIITNYHVVGEEREVIVKFPDHNSFKAEVIAWDRLLDVALLRLEQTGLPVLKLATGPLAEENTPVYVIGNPLYFDNIINQGAVAGLQPGRVPATLMIDAPVYKGNSGSPVINPEGEVIGIIFATTQFDQGEERKKVGLAVPVQLIQEEFADILSQQKSDETFDF